MVRLLSAWAPRIDLKAAGVEANARRFDWNIRRLAGAALDLLLPPSCVGCSAPVDRPGLLCGACFGALSFIGEPCCGCCGRPFELDWHAVEGTLCQRCVDTPPPFERARAALTYDRASRRLVLPFKHADRIEFAGWCCRSSTPTGSSSPPFWPG